MFLKMVDWTYSRVIEYNNDSVLTEWLIKKASEFIINSSNEDTIMEAKPEELKVYLSNYYQKMSELGTTLTNKTDADKTIEYMVSCLEMRQNQVRRCLANII